MVYEIIAGRSPKEKERLGLAGTIFLGKHYVQMERIMALSNPVYLDVSGPHVVLLSGKRGSGKSYSIGVIAEGLADLPEDIKNNLSFLIFDTMGIFWTMKYPNYKDDELLREWGLTPKGLQPIVFVPYGLYEDYQNKGVPVDLPFSIEPKEVSAESWAEIFGIDLLSDAGILLERAVEKAKQNLENFEIDELINLIEIDKEAEKKEKQILKNRLAVAKTWGLFKAEGTEILDLFKGGTTSILDLSAYAQMENSDRLKALVIGLVSKKILAQRMESRRAEEVKLISEGGFLFGQTSAIAEKGAPLVWLMIDECLPADSEIITSTAHTKIKDIVDRFENGEKFKVLGYDVNNKKYEYYDVIDVYKKGKRNIIKITTETGRELKCTPDHRVLTTAGFVSAVSANEIGVPLSQPYSEDADCIKARLVGHIFGDGWVSDKLRAVGFSGKNNLSDLEKIKGDLAKLGLKSSSIHSRKTKSQINSRKYGAANVFGTSQELTCSREAYRIFKPLVGFSGEKVLAEIGVPEWILNGPNKIKAEFLSALFGSDGQIISQSKNANGDFNAIRLYFNKAEHLIDCGWAYAKQLEKLLTDLGIRTSSVKVIPANIRKDGIKTIKFTITLAKEIENAIKFLELVGYKYCERKELAGTNWLEYLKARLFVIKERGKLRLRALDLHKTGLGKIRIARQLGLPDSQIREWIYFNSGAGVPKGFPDLKTWVGLRCEGGIIFERVIRAEIQAPEELFDIGVNKVHNFIANRFIVHNCHEFLPRTGKTLASNALIQILREGRQPGISLVLATQQPGKIHTDVMTQADVVLSHRVTSKIDLTSLNEIAATYLAFDIQRYIDGLPAEQGTAILLDDKLEKIYPIKVRPRYSWHGGEDPTAIKGQLKELGLA